MSRVFIITGTSKGIGNALARLYLDEGHTIIGCSRNTPNINHTNYHHYTLDANDEKSVIDMIKEIGRKFKVDILINNIGTTTLNHIATTNLDLVDEIYRVNFRTTFLFTKEVAKIMMKNRKGSIVNISSIAVPLNLEGEAVYASMKSAIEKFTQISAKEFGYYGIRINALGVSPTKTNLIKALPKDKLDSLLSKLIIKDYCEFEDIKNGVDFLISDKSRFITAQTIYLGGVC
ncbi:MULTISPECIES: SDR family NAD(P)-dependent oxidoreductase [Campylobacter]|uniref:SDR family NAD(P)-dependent oxidoreductase n=1 Tax=Campylobacter TaxID=194 RepID=UPI000A32B9EB|nr:SDR family oxidoreductase [Campylobacter sp. P0024]MCR8679846.1 SDR family oxidoreductase [Campylobacter sp. RM19072]